MPKFQLNRQLKILAKSVEMEACTGPCEFARIR